MLHYNIEVPLLDSEQVYSVKLILVFGYNLYVSENLPYGIAFAQGLLTVVVRIFLKGDLFTSLG